jgi:glycosyltransferase involved in cell wall biosynthesis
MSIGIVIIGRNEASRLPACFDSVRAIRCPVVYVDSGSTDASVSIARSAGLQVLQLDPARPFSAARARNEGVAALLVSHPAVDLVQFLDGDCTLLPGWIDAATAAMRDNPDCAAVLGHTSERRADASFYNRLCAIEWRSSVGNLKDYGQLGGISMMRVDVFRKLGGFRVDVIAGEDSELGVRMALAGHRVLKLDSNMAIHDADMTRFSQWWRRAVRAGHAIGQRSDLNGRTAIRDCVHERNSTVFWGIVLPITAVLAALSTSGWSLLLLLSYPALALKIARQRRAMGDGMRDAYLYATFTVIGKFANALGLSKFALSKLHRRYEIIEYK